jgi:hypothetical protein
VTITRAAVAGGAQLVLYSRIPSAVLAMSLVGHASQLLARAGLVARSVAATVPSSSLRIVIFGLLFQLALPALA